MGGMFAAACKSPHAPLKSGPPGPLDIPLTTYYLSYTKQLDKTNYKYQCRWFLNSKQVTQIIAILIKLIIVF